MFEKDGFLSEEVSDLTTGIDSLYPGLWALACEINEFAMKLQYALEIQIGVVSELMGAPLFSRVLSHYQALLILSKRGMLDQAYVLLRVLTEALFQLSAIANDTNFAIEYVRHEEYQRKTLLSKLKRFKESQNQNDPEILAVDSKIKEIEREIVERNIKKFPTEQVAHKAGLHGWYDTVYAHSSSYVHTSARSLESHLVLRNGSEEILEMANEPVLKGLHFPISAGIEAILIAVSKTCRLFGLEEPLELSGFHERCHTLLGSYAQP